MQSLLTYLGIIILYILACVLFYFLRTMRVPSRGGWIYRDDDPEAYWALISLFCVQIGLLVFGLIFYNWAKLKLGFA
jgi:hypothetical protein